MSFSVDRGQDYAVYQRITSFTNQAGTVQFQTNRFTLPKRTGRGLIFI